MKLSIADFCNVCKCAIAVPLWGWHELAEVPLIHNFHQDINTIIVLCLIIGLICLNPAQGEQAARALELQARLQEVEAQLASSSDEAENLHSQLAASAEETARARQLVWTLAVLRSHLHTLRHCLCAFSSSITKLEDTGCHAPIATSQSTSNVFRQPRLQQ